MNISSDFIKDLSVPDKPSGAYQWWYFDAISRDHKWALVIIFYHGNPFSPDYIRDIDRGEGFPENYPALSVSLYRHGEPEYYSFVESDPDAFEWNQEQGAISIGASTVKQVITDKLIEYRLNIVQELDSGHALHADICFSSKKSTLQSEILSKEKETGHNWNLVQPHAKVSGEFEVNGKNGTYRFDFNGTGYHDSNTGCEPMKEAFKEWYWGRIHFLNYTFVYYMMNQFGANRYQGWLLDNRDLRIVDEITDFRKADILPTRFGLRTARKIVFKSSFTEISVLQTKVLDNGPFYQRFSSEAFLEQGTRKLAGIGISEYMKPDRIYWRVFWPLVRMRLRNTSKRGHWVQSSRRLYEYTW